MSVPEGGSFALSKVSAPKSYELLAAQLREAILAGEIPEGASLPTERDLVLQSGISRPSVREALRILSAEGLVRARQGRTGGSIVTLPSSDNLVQLIGQFVRGRQISVRALYETRELIEPLLAGLAATRRTLQNMQRLRSLHEDLVAAAANYQRFSVANVAWHLAVAEASQNELLTTFLRSISSGVAVATTIEEYDTGDTRQAVIRIHHKINDAIEQQDSAKAERYMRAHLAATTLHAGARVSGEGAQPQPEPRAITATPRAGGTSKSSLRATKAAARRT